jgi:hypothetical protein
VDLHEGNVMIEKINCSKKDNKRLMKGSKPKDDRRSNEEA